MSRFELEKLMPSCDVSKELISQLEDYIIEQASQNSMVDRKKVADNYSVTLDDNFGVEEISSIKNYIPSAFPDSTSQISMSLWIYQRETEKPLKITIRFNRDKIYCKMSIGYTSDNAREIVLGLYEGIKRLIDPHRNSNRLFHPHPILKGALFGVIWIPLMLIVQFLNNNDTPSALLSLGGFCLLLLYFVGGKLKPYISFDSRSSQRNRRLTNWFFYGLLGFLMFGTVAVAFRKMLMGW